MGIAGLVLGIIAVVIGLFAGAFGWVGLIVGIIGIILSALACKKEKKGINTAGLVLSIIGTALCLIFWLACAACVASAGGLSALM